MYYFKLLHQCRRPDLDVVKLRVLAGAPLPSLAVLLDSRGAARHIQVQVCGEGVSDASVRTAGPPTWIWASTSHCFAAVGVYKAR